MEKGTHMARLVRGVIGLALLSFAIGGPVSSPAWAATASPEVAVSNFATGFPSAKGIGPLGLAFDAGGDLFVSAGTTLYRFGPGGGTASSPEVGSVPGATHVGGLAIGGDGSLYSTRVKKGSGGGLR